MSCVLPTMSRNSTLTWRRRRAGSAGVGCAIASVGSGCALSAARRSSKGGQHGVDQRIAPHGAAGLHVGDGVLQGLLGIFWRGHIG